MTFRCIIDKNLIEWICSITNYGSLYGKNSLMHSTSSRNRTNLIKSIKWNISLLISVNCTCAYTATDNIDDLYQKWLISKQSVIECKPITLFCLQNDSLSKF